MSWQQREVLQMIRKCHPPYVYISSSHFRLLLDATKIPAVERKTIGIGMQFAAILVAL